MTAIPLRVIEDAPALTALHLAAETSFQAARDPTGGPVRDLGNWVSTATTWRGGSFIRLLTAGAWWCVDLEFCPKSEFVGYYVNFQRPVERTSVGFDTVDLVLDLVVDTDGVVAVKDLEDFEAAVSDGYIDEDVAAKVRSEAARIRYLFDDGRAPLDADRWRGWRAPDHWGPLPLPRVGPVVGQEEPLNDG